MTDSDNAFETLLLLKEEGAETGLHVVLARIAMVLCVFTRTGDEWDDGHLLLLCARLFDVFSETARICVQLAEQKSLCGRES